MALLSSLLSKPKNSVSDQVNVLSTREVTTRPIIQNDHQLIIERGNNKISLIPGKSVIPLETSETGRKKYEILSRIGHSEDRLIQARFEDLMPKDLGVGSQINLERPSESEIEGQISETQAAINSILMKKTAVGSVKSTMGEGGFVKFTPQGGGGETRIIKMVEMPKDPLDPPKFSHKRVPKPPPSPPAPVLHSPPRKVSAEEQRNWYVPPCISNWKNPKGYTIPLDKRLAADGRGLQEARINPNFSSFAESLYLAEKHARESVEKRANVEKKLAETERKERENTLRQLAQKAREEKAAINAEIVRESHLREGENIKIYDQEEEEGSSRFGPIKVLGGDQGTSIREREEMRRNRIKDYERDLRFAKMSEEKRSKYIERISDRDVSEKIALGQNVPTTAVQSEILYDQRLFDQSEGLDQGFRDDEAYAIYDKPLFTGSAAHLIYKPTISNEFDSIDETGEISPTEKQDSLIKHATKSFQGTDWSVVREGPVQFEREEDALKSLESAEFAAENDSDPFGLDRFLSEAKNSVSSSKKSRRI